MTGQPLLTLDSLWIDDGSQTGRMQLKLFAPASTNYPAATRLAFTSLTRIPPGTALDGARMIKRVANYHELAPLKDFAKEPSELPEPPEQPGQTGLIWQIDIPALSHRPAHLTDGPKSAFLILPDGATVPIRCQPLRTQSQPRSGSGLPAGQGLPSVPLPVSPPDHAGSQPRLGLLPMANQVQVENWASQLPSHLHFPKQLEQAGKAVALYHRLFSDIPHPPAGTEGGLSIAIRSLGDPVTDCVDDHETYRLTFAPDGVILEANDQGLLYGCIALLQIWRAAKLDPSRFGLPQNGTIEDWPKSSWRGMHLDVSRQFYTPGAISAFLDCLAWHRINRFHWHLSDDEGWRLESKVHPSLTSVGAWRGHGLPLLPQHGSGPDVYGGFYRQDEVRSIVAHACDLGITIIPEIDVPGHSHAALMAVPALLDPSAMDGGSSVQGYVNNALNPGLGATWAFLEAIFAEVCDLFPGPYVHIGGDEVADMAWSGSRAAQSWARAKGHVNDEGRPDTMKMQAAILRFVAGQLTAAGKVSLAWEEAAKGGGLDPDQSILMAWMKAQSGADLVQKGYRVIMCPGEAYYLDMAQSSDWNEPGLSWAGTSSVEQTYHFDPLAGLEGKEHMVLGLQGCIWSENLTSRALFNHMVFPRLSAIAERAWSLVDPCHWQSFEARAACCPKMPPEV